MEILMSVSARNWHGERMTTTGGAGPRSGGATWAGEAIVTTCVIVALLPMVVLHVTGIGAVDPLHHVISDYVFQPGGYALLGIAALCLGGGTVVLAAGLRHAGLPRPRLPFALLVSVAVAFVLVAVFPTHAAGTSAGLVSNVHRAAGGWIFAMLPLAAWQVARRARSAPAWQPAAPALARLSGATGVAGVFFLLTHVPIVIGGSPGFPLIGGVQRVLFLAVMLVLVATARATRLAVDRAPVSAALASGDHRLTDDPGLRGVA
ncbi:hypothetical protein BJF78_07785 [Pseudonocardia sp. CNS-139]|nr:hypothetical protein BJF78_07785 [Pseudonocardia sp. CNS-139]